MGRHHLHPVPRQRRRAGAHRAPSATGHRIALPTAVAAVLLVSGTSGVALAADEQGDDTPSSGLDMVGGTLGTLSGTDRPATDEEPAGTGAEESGAEEAPERPATDGESSDGTAASGDASASAQTPAGQTPAGGASASGEMAGSATAPDATAAEPGQTRVTLMEKNGSGVSGTATMDARRIVATASGMDPNERYVSFFYGATSSATNNNPCILDGTNPLPSNQTIGEWKVDEKGNGTLSAPNPLGARYTLQAGTMSIRKVEHGFSKATAVPVNPASYSLVACGEVQRMAVLDPVTSNLPKLPKMPAVPMLSSSDQLLPAL
jgi:hypothetical protein